MTSGYRMTDTWLGTKCDTLADILEPGLTCVFIGLNPSPVSVEAGHYLQGTLGRQYWELLTAYGILPKPENGGFHDDLLLENGFGITDLAKRPSARANTLTREDIECGAEMLRHKIERYRPKLVTSVYKASIEALTGKKYPKHYGLLPDTIGDTRLFVAPFPYRSRQEVGEYMPQLRELIDDLRGKITKPTILPEARK